MNNSNKKKSSIVSPFFTFLLLQLAAKSCFGFLTTTTPTVRTRILTKSIIRNKNNNVYPAEPFISTRLKLSAPSNEEEEDDNDDDGDFFSQLSSSSPSTFTSTTSPSTTTDSSFKQSLIPTPQELAAEEFPSHLPKINTVTLVGRIGQSPEPRYFDDGKVVLRLSLAVKRKLHPLERQARQIAYGQEETDWFNLELWGRDAEYATKYVTKGARVGITGSLNIDAWVDKVSGEDRTSVKIVVKHLDILESRAEAELRMGRRGGGGNYNNNSGGDGGGGYSGGNSYNSGDNDMSGDGPSPAGSGGFFD